jgi:hypothetical protein
MKLFVLMLAAGFSSAQIPVYPRQMAPVLMLAGQWAAEGAGGGGWVEFHMAPGGREMIGRAKGRGPQARWRRMRAIFPEGPAVRADFFDAQDHIIHYRLGYSDASTLRFVSDPGAGAAVRTLTYEKLGPEDLRYRFETNGRTVDSGTLSPKAELRPLTE